MNHPPEPSSKAAERLCLSCGLCCNGVIFARLKLQPEDDVARLRALGLPIQHSESRHPKSAARHPVAQPCAALDGFCCRIYGERPKYCREFECLLLQGVQAGRTGEADARRVIATARERAEKVRRLLRLLGETDESVALSLRFRSVRRRMETKSFDEQAAAAYADLTLAVHDLNVLLSEAFYPGLRGP